MPYSKKTWNPGASGGTPITASELNRIEQGIHDAHNELAAHLADDVRHTSEAEKQEWNNTQLLLIMGGF